jgi:hypothetical protein
MAESAQKMSATVRRVTADDIDECMDFAMPLFAAHFPEMDWGAVRKNAEQWIGNPHILVIRTDNAVGVATTRVSLWEPFTVGVEEFVAANKSATPFEAVAIYRAMIEWAASLGAKKFRLGSANGVDVGPIAKRLGGKLYQTIYEVEV